VLRGALRCTAAVIEQDFLWLLLISSVCGIINIIIIIIIYFVLQST